MGPIEAYSNISYEQVGAIGWTDAPTVPGVCAVEICVARMSHGEGAALVTPGRSFEAHSCSYIMKMIDENAPLERVRSSRSSAARTPLLISVPVQTGK